MSAPLRLLSAVLLVVLPPALRARERPTAEQPFPAILAEAQRLDAFAAGALDRLRKLGIPTREDVSAEFPLGDFVRFARLVRSDAGAKLPEREFPGITAQLEGFELSLAVDERLPHPLPVFEAVPNLNNGAVLYFFTDRRAFQGEIADPGREFDLPTGVGVIRLSRLDALSGLKEAIAPYRQALASDEAAQARDYALRISAEWDDYFERARPQSPLDILATTVAERRHLNRDELVGPPPRQWFLLRPNVVVESLEAAPDGDQIGGAIALEWVGVNFWNQKLPIGVSLTSLASDREGVDDLGHGVSLYFANKYCIGWASHGGDNGFYFSIDTAKFVTSKRGMLEGYRARLRDFRSTLGR
ncbi:MAG TPA: hypothetical protein VEB66_01685 [Opitutaceae bacterium]|nr:hypothetical protein [Opitutaceae bacterium]